MSERGIVSIWDKRSSGKWNLICTFLQNFCTSEVYPSLALKFRGIQLNITEYKMGDKENLLLTELDEDCPPEDEVFEEKKDEKV